MDTWSFNTLAGEEGSYAQFATKFRERIAICENGVELKLTTIGCAMSLASGVILPILCPLAAVNLIGVFPKSWMMFRRLAPASSKHYSGMKTCTAHLHQQFGLQIWKMQRWQCMQAACASSEIRMSYMPTKTVNFRMPSCVPLMSSTAYMSHLWKAERLAAQQLQ